MNTPSTAKCLLANKVESINININVLFSTINYNLKRTNSTITYKESHNNGAS